MKRRIFIPRRRILIPAYLPEPFVSYVQGNTRAIAQELFDRTLSLFEVNTLDVYRDKRFERRWARRFPRGLRLQQHRKLEGLRGLR